VTNDHGRGSGGARGRSPFIQWHNVCPPPPRPPHAGPACSSSSGGRGGSTSRRK
jgi:hypothetical protein